MFLFPLMVPAQIAPPPPSSPMIREITFPGFNALPLKATVQAAEGHPYFAVMVPDSGPVDRDGYSPLMRDPRTGKPIPSHSTRDVAAWLAMQGLGSLRYDKRFANSKDPKLDASLEAQLGDIKATIAHARTLPEAKGRRLLLIGHGEGALLSLLVASEPDALLLWAPPTQSMARTIRQQIESQLPADRAPANLTFLEATLQAIRTGQSCPSPGAGVLPQLVAFARTLMAPETLAFVKATLDLDPWVLAARAPVPLAACWGAKDIQVPYPTKLPATFPGKAFEVKDANHLLKRDPRPRTELNPGSALAAYGDDVPLADLSPLAEWLASLRQSPEAR